MKWIKFHDVASSANTADTVNFIEVDELKYISTTATSVIFHSVGAGAAGGLDTTTITCATGKSVTLAEMILNNAGNLSHGGMFTVDVNTGTSSTLISDISYVAVS
tara:strand:+ start:61 stop:375 length:315 start_codon:yes stop_codon:yes gene_type:complete